MYTDIKGLLNEEGELNLTGFENFGMENNEQDHMFHNEDLNYIKKIIIGNTLKEIGIWLFHSAELIKEVNFTGTILNKIPEQTFAQCYSLENIELPENIKIIEEMAFRKCFKLKSIILHGVEIIEKHAFKGCDSLEYIEISDNLKEIDNEAFICLVSNQNKKINRNIKIKCNSSFEKYFKYIFTNPDFSFKDNNSFVIK